MATKPSVFAKLQLWWQDRIIRTKILIGIFVGVFIYQSISTTYQMQKVESDILSTYNEKALNLSVAIDCIVLKDGVLFFNLLDRISRTEVVGIQINENHPSCVEREAFLKRLKAAHFEAFKQQQSADENPVENQSATPSEELDEDVVEYIPVEDDTAVAPSDIPLDLTFDPEELQGRMEETRIVINGEDRSQLLYTVPVNGVEVTFDLTDLPERKLDRFLTLSVTALGNLLVLFIIIWLITGQIVGPLKKLTDFTQRVIKSGAIQKGEAIELVPSPGRDEVGILTRAFNQMIARLQKSYHQIIKSKAAVGDLLDNTGQGFFSFGPDYLVNEEYSKACEEFFQHPIDSMDALELMVPEKKEEVKELTNLVFNGIGDLNMLEDLLPNEIEMHGRILDMDYRFIKSTNKEISDKMMVILTDVTQQRELAKLLEKDQMINELIIRIARDKDAFIQFVQDTDALLQQTLDDLKMPGFKVDSTLLLRQFHTLKGGAGSFGLVEFANHAHAIEDQVQRAASDQRLHVEEVKQALSEEVNQMVYILRNSLDHVQDIITWEEIDQNRSTIYKIPKEKLDRLETLIQQISEPIKEAIEAAYQHLKRQPIKPVLKKYASTASAMAEKLGKPVRVVTRGTGVEVPFERFNPLFDTLVHLVRNSVDHGLEDSETRIALGKPEEGNLIIEAKQEAGKVKLVISDDGAGINPEKIRSSAVKKGLISEAKAQHLADDEAIKLIFKPGFSTAESVSTISGRGVGMDAVKAALKELEGSIAIRTAINKGTTFVLSVPL